MNNIEELKSAYRDVELTARNMRGKPEEYRVVTGFCPVNVVEMQAQKIQALIAQLEGAQKERDDLREKVNQADSEWHKMADRILSAGKRAEKAETALSAANEKLKGEQVPVAVIVLSKNWPDTGRKVIDYYIEKIQHLPVGTELFTASQKPVVLPRVAAIHAALTDVARHRTSVENIRDVVEAVKAAGSKVEGE